MPTTFADGSFFESTYLSNVRAKASFDTSQAEPINFHAGVSSFDIQEMPKFEFQYPGEFDEIELVHRLNISIFSYRKFHSCPSGKFFDAVFKLC